MIQKIFDSIDAREQEYKDFLRDIVCMESYTPDKADVDGFNAYLTQYTALLEVERKATEVL